MWLTSLKAWAHNQLRYSLFETESRRKYLLSSSGPLELVK